MYTANDFITEHKLHDQVTMLQTMTYPRRHAHKLTPTLKEAKEA